MTKRRNVQRYKEIEKLNLKLNQTIILKVFGIVAFRTWAVIQIQERACP